MFHYYIGFKDLEQQKIKQFPDTYHKKFTIEKVVYGFFLNILIYIQYIILRLTWKEREREKLIN